MKMSFNIDRPSYCGYFIIFLRALNQQKVLLNNFYLLILTLSPLGGNNRYLFQTCIVLCQYNLSLHPQFQLKSSESFADLLFFFYHTLSCYLEARQRDIYICNLSAEEAKTTGYLRLTSQTIYSTIASLRLVRVLISKLQQWFLRLPCSHMCTHIYSINK